MNEMPLLGCVILYLICTFLTLDGLVGLIVIEILVLTLLNELCKSNWTSNSIVAFK